MGRLRPEEISSILKGAITDYESRTRTEEVGQVLQVGDGIAQVHGLTNVMYQEMIEFEDNRGETVTGIALSLEEDNVGVVVVGEDRHIRGEHRPAHGAPGQHPGGQRYVGPGCGRSG